MVSLGDTLAVIGILVGVCLSSWAVLMGFATLFPHRCDASCSALRAHPVRMTLLGLVIWLVFGTIGLVLLNVQVPIAKLGGTMWLMALVAVNFIGAAGLSRLVSLRLRQMDSSMTEYGALSRGSVIVVTSGLLPLVGWFAIIPMLMASGMGAGLAAVFARQRKPHVLEPQFDFGR